MNLHRILPGLEEFTQHLSGWMDALENVFFLTAVLSEWSALWREMMR